MTIEVCFVLLTIVMLYLFLLGGYEANKDYKTILAKLEDLEREINKVENDLNRNLNRIENNLKDDIDSIKRD